MPDANKTARFHCPKAKKSSADIPRMRPYEFDLFGEIPVSESDLLAWVSAVAPAYLSSERSYQAYLKNYDIPAKVRRAKLTGDFDQIIAMPRRAFHVRLALNAVL